MLQYPPFYKYSISYFIEFVNKKDAQTHTIFQVYACAISVNVYVLLFSDSTMFTTFKPLSVAILTV